MRKDFLSYRFKRILLCLCLVSAALLPACEEDVQVNLGIDRPFTMWGVLNPEIPVNGVRIFEILPTIQILQREEIDATVEVTNLTSGLVEMWRDSVVTLQDGDFRHVFWSDTQIEYNNSYQIVTRRSDGEQVSATVSVPDSVSLEIIPDDQTQVSQIFVPVEIIGDPPALTRITVTYTVAGQDIFTGVEVFSEVPLSYTNDQEPTDRGYVVPIELRSDLRRINSFLAERNVILQVAELREMRLDVHVGNAEWVAPNGVFDPNILVEPGLLSNVENGFGFVGAGFVETVVWRPSGLLVRRAGFL